MQYPPPPCPLPPAACRLAQDRLALLDKFKAKQPPASAFEEKFARFQRVRAHAPGAPAALPGRAGAAAACSLRLVADVFGAHACALGPTK